ncbi:MAG: hypothetical protein EHM40_02680 [Chloroflexi bacterium]|nr:MAG: hypothetical protein EHM40_02680 [Chloroflexota bacterium]
MPALLRRALIMMLVLAFSLGSAVWVAPAQAAPSEELIIYRMIVTLPPDPICVGRDYFVNVRISANQQYLGQDGELHDLTSVGINGKRIEAFANDESIATLSSSASITGWDVDNDAPGEVTFKLHTNKAGTTDLFFEAYIREAEASQQEPYFGPKETIKVVSCKYEVTMNATDVYTGDGVTIWTAGNLNTEITGDGGEMQGSGSFAFDSGFVGPPCSISYSEYQNATTITGHLDDSDQLILDFQYQPGQITSQVSCPDGGGSGSQTIDLTNTGIASVTFPATGGTRALTFTYAGSDFPPGTMIIDVQPVSEEAGS